MSVEALGLVLKIEKARLASSPKFVLLALANCADAAGTCYPSVEHLVEATAQDRKTVLANIERLVADGWITDTGDRRGRTRQVKVWRLNLEKAVPQKELFHAERKRSESGPLLPPEPENTPESGPNQGPASNPNPEQFQIRNSSVSSPKESQIRDTEPLEPCIPVGASGHMREYEGRQVESRVLAVILLRNIGLTRIVPHDPRLLAALDAGVTPEDLVEVAKAYPGKGAAYVIAAAVGIHEKRLAETAKPKPAAPTTAARPAPAPAGCSPEKPDTPQIRYQTAVQFARQMVDIGEWTEERAKQHINEARAKHLQQETAVA